MKAHTGSERGSSTTEDQLALPHHHAHAISEEDTSYIQLKHGRKTVYTRHRCFLKSHHPYRRLKKAFNGSQEHETVSIPLTGHQVFQRVQHLNTIFGNTQKKEKK